MIFKDFEIVLVLLGQFQIFKNALRQFIPNRSPKHVITSAYYILQLQISITYSNFELINLGTQFLNSIVCAFKRQFEYTKTHTLKQLKEGF